MNMNLSFRIGSGSDCSRGRLVNTPSFFFHYIQLLVIQLLAAPGLISLMEKREHKQSDSEQKREGADGFDQREAITKMSQRGAAPFRFEI